MRKGNDKNRVFTPLATIYHLGVVAIESYIQTTDDWSPNFNHNQVRLRLTLNLPDKDKFFHRVSVWGADDLGMEKDFYEDSTIEAVKLYHTLRCYNTVNRDMLHDFDFKYA